MANMAIFCKLSSLNAFEFRHAGPTFGLGLESSIIFISSFKKSRNRGVMLCKK